MVDPWPVRAGDRNIAYNGERCGAVERYRTGQRHPPVNAHQHIGGLAAASAAATNNSAGRASDQRQPAAPREVSRERAHANRPSRDASTQSWCVLPPTPAFEQPVRATFGASGADRAARRVRRACRATTTSSISSGATVVVIDLDAGQPDEMAALDAADGAARRLAAGDRRDPGVRRERGAHAAADAGRRFPGEAGAAARSGARLRARRAGPAATRRRPRRRSTPSCPRSAAPA